MKTKFKTAGGVEFVVDIKKYSPKFALVTDLPQRVAVHHVSNSIEQVAMHKDKFFKSEICAAL